MAEEPSKADYVTGCGCLSAVVIAAIVGLGFCTRQSPEEAKRSQSERAETRLIVEARLAVKDRLRDPASARFDGERVTSRPGGPYVCGFVNSKNGFGGYAGRSRYVFASGRMVLEDEISGSDFETVWMAMC
jgi:hypothetical protein